MRYSSHVVVLVAEQKNRVHATPGIRRASHTVPNHLRLHSSMWDTICCWTERRRWRQGGCFLLRSDCSPSTAGRREATPLHLHRSDMSDSSHLRCRRELFSSVTLRSDECRSHTLLSSCLRLSSASEANTQREDKTPEREIF